MSYPKKLLVFCILFMIPLKLFAITTQNEENIINVFIKNIIHAYEKRDVNTLMKSYAQHAIVIGTGTDEILQGKDEIANKFKRDFKQSTNADIKLNKIKIQIKNGCAFVTCLLAVKVSLSNQHPFQSILRFSAGLIKKNNRWLIAQSHLSAPLSEQKAGNSF